MNLIVKLLLNTMKILIFQTLDLFFSNGYSNNNFFDSFRSKYGKENNSYSIEVKPSYLEKKVKKGPTIRKI